MINISAKIRLDDGTDIYIDSKYILSLEANLSDRASFSEPSVGVISTNGYVTISDFDNNTIYKLLQNGKIQNQRFAIYLNNTLGNHQTRFFVYIISQCIYNVEDKTARINLNDDLIEWQDINIEFSNLQTNQTAYNVYEYLKEKTPNKWNHQELDNNTASILRAYTIDKAYLKSGSLWSQWNKLCYACGLHVFKNTSNRVCVCYDFRS